MYVLSNEIHETCHVDGFHLRVNLTNRKEFHILIRVQLIFPHNIFLKSMEYSNHNSTDDW